MNLIECLQEVEDPRRLQGQRYSSVSMLLIIIMGILRGNYGYREIGRFSDLNKSIFIKKFGFKNQRVPSYVSIRTFILGANFSSIQKAFHKWSRNYVKIKSGEWIAIDGKSIRSTLSDYSTDYQNFVSLVSLFCSKREQILHVEKFENKKANEGQIVDYLLEILDLKDVIFTLDALHCKKNSKQNRRKTYLYQRQNNLADGWENINLIIYVRREFLSKNKEHKMIVFMFLTYKQLMLSILPKAYVLIGILKTKDKSIKYATEIFANYNVKELLYILNKQ